MNYRTELPLYLAILSLVHVSSFYLNPVMHVCLNPIFLKVQDPESLILILS